MFPSQSTMASSQGSAPDQAGIGAATGAQLVQDSQENSWDAVETYFECITTCSLDDGECITRCVEQLREQH